MGRLVEAFDMAMCVLWMLTYTLVLIGTVRYRYPMISPISQIFFGTNEFAVLLYFLTNASEFNRYVIVAYVLWALIEIAIFAAILKVGFLKKEWILPYLLSIAVVSLVLYFLIGQGYMLFICYFNAFFGVLFWLGFILDREFPMKPIALAAFVAKFLADVFAIPVNLGQGGKLVELICLSLPVLDLIFIPVYFKRKKTNKNRKKR